MKKLALLLILFCAFLSCGKKSGGTQEVIPLPEISSISPATAKAGDVVIITGKNFGSNPVVYFGSVNAIITSKSSTELKVSVPNGSGSSGVYIQNGTQKSNTVSFTYLVDVAVTPVLTSIQFKSAITGDTLIASGEHFDASSKILFGTTAAQKIDFTPGSITAIIPVGSGTTMVTVQNSYDGVVKTSNQLSFSYTQIANDNYALLVMGGVPYRLDTLSYFKIGPGIDYMVFRLTETSGTKPLRVFLATFDGTNQYVNFQPVIGRDSVSNHEKPSDMAKRKSSAGNQYVVGTNSDYWDVANQTAYPRNTNMVNGVLASRGDNKQFGGSYYRGNAIFDVQKRLHIDNLIFSASASFGNQTIEIDTINYYKYTQTDKLIFFNIYCGKTTGTDNARTEIAVTPLNGSWNYAGETEVKVVDVYANKGNNAVSSNISILSGGSGVAAGFLNQLKKDDVLNVKFNLIPRRGGNYVPYNVTGGWETVLRDDVVQPDVTSNSVVKNPRTAIGYSNNGNRVYLCVVDGRQPGVSEGVLGSELGELMKYFGATDVLNFDGGGSTTMYLDKLGTVNSPSDATGERAVVAGLFAVSTAPVDNQVVEIVPSQYIVRLGKGGTFTPVFYGLNKYGHIVNSNITGVTIHTNGLGSYTGGRFVAGSQNALGYIIATYNNLRTRIKIFIQ